MLCACFDHPQYVSIYSRDDSIWLLSFSLLRKRSAVKMKHLSRFMLLSSLTLLKGITVSALSLQIVQPISPAKSKSNDDFALPNGLGVAANVSLISNFSNTIPQQWDGTIALPLNELNISHSSPLSNDSSELWNDTYISLLNTSAGPRPRPRPGPRPALDLPPLPRGWGVSCDGRYGTGMKSSSCLEAWALVPPVERELSFGPRDAANTYDVGLPKRYQSCTLACSPMTLVPC